MVQRGRRKNSNKGPSAVAAVATGSGQPHNDSSAATVTPVEDQPRKRGRPIKDSSSAPPPKKWRICTANHVEVQVQAPPDGQPVLSARAQRLLRRNQIKDAQLLTKPTPKAKAPIVVHHSEPDPEPQVIVNANQVEPGPQIIVEPKPPVIFKGCEGRLQVPRAFTQVVNSLPRLQAEDAKDVKNDTDKPQPMLKDFEEPEPVMPTLIRERPMYNAKQFLARKKFEEELDILEAYLYEVHSIHRAAEVVGQGKVEVDLEPEVDVSEKIKEDSALATDGVVERIEHITESDWTPHMPPEYADQSSTYTPLSDMTEPENWFLQSVPTPQTPANILDIWLDDREQVLFAKPAATHLISTTGKEVEGHLDQPPLTPKWDQMDQFMQVMELRTPASTSFGPKDDPTTPLPNKGNQAAAINSNPTTSANLPEVGIPVFPNQLAAVPAQIPISAPLPNNSDDLRPAPAMEQIYVRIWNGFPWMDY